MKPLPTSGEGLWKEAGKLGIKENFKQEQNPSRKQLIQFALLSSGIKRSFCQASCLIVGKSGVGKSSTINHLFGLEDGDINFVKISENESMTKNTTEHVIKTDSPDFETEGLTLGIVDTAGFNDTTGQKTDACTMYSIRKFYDTHPNLKGCYPNLILIMVAASDSRIKGENSDFTKSLKILKKLNLVDPKFPNVVGVLTIADFLKPKKRWAKKLEERQGVISEIIFNVLGVEADVVPIENMYEDLETEGDGTLLPDGTLQPHNLFEACDNLMAKNDDKLGMSICAQVFGLKKESKKNVSLGFEMKTKDSKNNKLNEAEKGYHEFIQKIAKGGLEDPLRKEVEDFKAGRREEEEKTEIQAIYKVLKDLDIEDLDDLEFLTVGHIIEKYNKPLSDAGKEFLVKLGIKKDPPTVTEVGLMGRGYNVLTDRTVPALAMDLEYKTVNGVNIPDLAYKENINDTKFISDYFENNFDAVTSRLNSMNIGMKVDVKLFSVGARAGVTNHSNEKVASGSKEYSFLHEKRHFQLNFANFGQEGIKFTNGFKSAIEDLPKEFDEKDKNQRSRYERFFNKWGHFIVTQAYAGGSVEYKTNSQFLSTENATFNEVRASVGASFGVGPLSIGAEVGAGTASGGNIGTSSHLTQGEYNWSGGRTDLHQMDKLNMDKLRKWQLSTLTQPTMLETEMTLEPISTLIKWVDPEKNDSAYEALTSLLGGQFTLLRESEIAETAKANKKQMDASRSRAEAQANSRSKANQPPARNKWSDALAFGLDLVFNPRKIILNFF